MVFFFLLKGHFMYFQSALWCLPFSRAGISSLGTVAIWGWMILCWGGAAFCHRGCLVAPLVCLLGVTSASFPTAVTTKKCLQILSNYPHLRTSVITFLHFNTFYCTRLLNLSLSGLYFCHEKSQLSNIWKSHILSGSHKGYLVLQVSGLCLVCSLESPDELQKILMSVSHCQRLWFD